MESTKDFDMRVDELVSHGDAELSDVRLHYVEAGPEDAPLVVMLHGFPEFWYSWRHQIVALTQAGYRVVVPDQRGYNTSDKPGDISDYNVTKLVGDVTDLLDFFDAESAHIIGHDWGAVVAWFFAMMEPERTRKLAVLNVPHPVTFQDGLKTFQQLRKSWYMGFFQLPFVPEKALSANDFRVIRRTFEKDPINPDAFSDSDIQRYVNALSQPGGLTGPINWYRAALRAAGSIGKHLAKIERPTMVIWGTHDKHLGEELAVPPERWVTDCRVEKLHDASHWVQCDRPDKVNALLLHFLAGD